jgi:predicted DCC family thiol-disulfide oxidoreductase YuxK
LNYYGPILLFDGACNLCNPLVRFVIRHDRSASVKFATLQSEAGKSFLAAKDLPEQMMDTVVLIEGEHCYLRSTAVLRIFRIMGGSWSILYGLIIIPRFIRDFFYNLTGKYRYRIFGKSKFCIFPSEAVNDRFIS